MENLSQTMLETPDLNQERLNKLKELFPDLFTAEGRLNEEELNKLTSNDGAKETERYDFRWFGKSQAKRNAYKPTNTTLIFDETRSINPLTSENIIIEGENLEVLKLLQCGYREQIKCIYIDPPYNTGQDFVYSDNYTEEKRPYWEMTGALQNGVKMTTNPDTSGRYHSNWLNMMYSRLLVARTLLKPKGVIFISIDENEEHNLRKLCDEVFGRENFVEKIVWNKRIPKNDKGIGNIHEYILLYKKESSEKLFFKMPKDGLDEVYNFVENLKKKKVPLDKAEQELKQFYKKKGYDRGITLYCNLTDDYRIWGKINVSFPNSKDGDRYDVLHPKTNKPAAVPDNGWRHSQKTFKTYLDYKNVVERHDGTFICGKVWFDKDERTQPSTIQYLDDVTDFLFRSIISLKSSGGKEFEDLMGFDFDHPKTFRLIKSLVSTIEDKDCIILDFFGGSGTTGQAVMELNKEDKGNRKFILVQLPELTDEKSSAYKAGYKKISDITIERNKRVVENLIAEKEAEHPNLFTENKDALKGLGFKVFQLVKSNFPRTEFKPDADKSDEENIKALQQYIEEKERQQTFKFNLADLLTEILLKQGFTLNFTYEQKAEFTHNNVFYATDGEKETLICLDEDLKLETIEQLKQTEQKFICLERALDTTRKWNLNHYLGEKFQAF